MIWLLFCWIFHNFNQNSIIMEGKSILALLAGAAAGLTLGILFAPASGEETREKIAEGAADAAHDLHVRARYVRRRINELKRTLADYGDDLKEDAKERITREIEKLEESIEENSAYSIDD